MNGEHTVVVSNKRRVKYEFTLKRSITIVKGDSGTGKTTLFDMIAAYTRSNDIGVTIQCDKRCVALVDIDWKNQLASTKDSIIFIDEGAAFVGSHDFAAAIKHSDNYYVIFTRENLYQLPYSVDEIYQIKTSGKFHSFEPFYKQHPGYIYGGNPSEGKSFYQILLTEDSKAGFRLYESYFKGTNIVCESALTKSNIFGLLLKKIASDEQNKIFVIADGAAFGSEADRVLKIQEAYPDKVTVCLPECFEWLILKSGLVKGENINALLAAPSNFIESSEFESWEQFFGFFLKSITKDTVFAYDKSSLAQAYKVKENSKKIIALIAHGNIH